MAAGHRVVIANSRGPGSLWSLVGELGDAWAADVPEAAAAGRCADRDSAQACSELLASHLPDARIVKAFNTMYFETLVTDLIDRICFAAVDTGSLAEGGVRRQPGTPIHNQPLTAREAEAALSA